MNRRILVFLAAVAVSIIGINLGADAARGVNGNGGHHGVAGLKPDAVAVKNLRARSAKAQKDMKSLSPKGFYIVVDTASNVLYLKKGDATVRSAVVSSGSGNVLEEPGGSRRWVFDTPRGVFKVNAKLKDPYWVRPDWAFIEEGKAIPTKFSDRVEGGVLGDYALGFGDGYFIHGTLYSRLLGRNVTHGCVRVGDEDLKAIYHTVGVGAPIFIF